MITWSVYKRYVPLYASLRSTTTVYVIGVLPSILIDWWCAHPGGTGLDQWYILPLLRTMHASPRWFWPKATSCMHACMGLCDGMNVSSGMPCTCSHCRSWHLFLSSLPWTTTPRPDRRNPPPSLYCAPVAIWAWAYVLAIAKEPASPAGRPAMILAFKVVCSLLKKTWKTREISPCKKFKWYWSAKYYSIQRAVHVCARVCTKARPVCPV